jgi:transcriptional regulator with PAS, ATPase and Fis domain
MEEAAVRLRALLHISTLLQSTRELYAARGTPTAEVFRQHLLALISDVVAFDTGIVFLYENGQAPATALVAGVLESKVPVFREHEIVVPMLLRDQAAGAIDLARTEAFDEADFQLVTAISQIASFAIENAFHLEWLQTEVKRLEQDLSIESDLLGESVPIVELRRRIQRVAPSDTTVLILGESGTGKELVARAVHRNSLRALKPFVAISCAALPETLLESELFGHEKGAFTGAFAQKIGKLEMAKGGTVFLDEIGEVPLSMQAKLLRVLQQREVERVGGNRPIPLDFRLIAATNRNLEELVRQGGFRQDLFYRLNVVTLHTPSLRSRSEDILPMAQHFLMRFGEKCGRRVTGISPEARALLRAYPWPGNVRELENAIERVVVLGSGDMILAEDLPEAVSEAQQLSADVGTGMLQDAVNAAKRAVVQRAFDQANHNHEGAARLLGVHPNYLYRLMKNMNLQLGTRRSGRS